MANQPRVATCLWYDGEAEEAADFYTSLLPDSKISSVSRLHPEGPALMVEFTLCGTPFQALNGGPQYQFTEAASISVSTQDQEETDRLWASLIADGGSEGRCAWLRDRFGMSWQIVPKALSRLLKGSDPGAVQRVAEAMLDMRKIDIAKLEAAYRGE